MYSGSKMDDMSVVRLWMVQVSEKQLQLFEKEVGSRIHQDKGIFLITFSVHPSLICTWSDVSHPSFLEGSYIIDFWLRKPHEHSLRELNADVESSRQAATKSVEQIDRIYMIQDIQTTSEKMHQSVTDFVHQMAERSEDISRPESFWDQCEAFGTTLTDLRQYADVGKPLGTQQIEDIVLLGKALKPFAWVVIRHLTGLPDGAPWTGKKYARTWEDLNACCRQSDSALYKQVPNTVIRRMANYMLFLKTIRSVPYSH